MTRTSLCVFTILIALPLADRLSPINDGEPHGAPPYLLEDGWTPLLNGNSLDGWHSHDRGPSEWFTTTGLYWDPIENAKQLLAVKRPGDRLVNGLKGHTTHLVTDKNFGDVELYLEFLLPYKSNSGVYLHGLYEVQILDSYGAEGPLRFEDCGGLPKRADGKGFAGLPPLRNASRRPGEWQSYQIWFRAPRFDGSGSKVENATFLRILHNGLLVQDNVQVDGPTLAHLKIPEAPENPLMLQGDHGPVAYRNIYIRPLRPIAKR